MNVFLDVGDNFTFSSSRGEHVLSFESTRTLSGLARYQTAGTCTIRYLYRKDVDFDDFEVLRYVRIENVFTGIISSIRYDRDVAVISVKHRMAYWDFPAYFPLYTNALVSEVVSGLIHSSRSKIRDKLRNDDGVLYAKVGRVQVGSCVVGSGFVDNVFIDTAKNTIGYFGDIDTLSLSASLDSLSMAEPGWLYEDKLGNIFWRNRSYYDSTPVDVVVSDTTAQLEQVSGVSHVVGRFIHRSASYGSVWSLEYDWSLGAGTHVIRRYPVDDQGRSVGLYGVPALSGLNFLSGEALIECYLDSNSIVFVIVTDGVVIASGLTVSCSAVYQSPMAEVLYLGQTGGDDFISLTTMWDSSDGDTLETHCKYLIGLYGSARQFVDTIEYYSSVAPYDLLDYVSINIPLWGYSEVCMVIGIDVISKSGKVSSIVRFAPVYTANYAIVGSGVRSKVGRVKVGY